MREKREALLAVEAKMSAPETWDRERLVREVHALRRQRNTVMLAAEEASAAWEKSLRKTERKTELVPLAELERMIELVLAELERMINKRDRRQREAN